jgi:hypothetical protein
MTHAVGMGHPFPFYAQTSAVFNFWNFLGGDHASVNAPYSDSSIDDANYDNDDDNDNVWTYRQEDNTSSNLHASSMMTTNDSTATTTPSTTTSNNNNNNNNSSTSRKDRDLIVNLPGLYFDPGFDQYAGYFNVHHSHSKNLFYWYVESQGNPESDPVIFWTNGTWMCVCVYACVCVCVCVRNEKEY